jgi:TrmH family RNA methyltransferase
VFIETAENFYKCTLLLNQKNFILFIVFFKMFQKQSRFVNILLKNNKPLSVLLSSSSSSSSSSSILISSFSNNKIKLIKSLQLKKNRQELNLILIEGHKQIIDALNNGLIPSIILLSHKAEIAPKGKDLLKCLTNSIISEKVYNVTDNIIHSISDTKNSQGVIAAFLKPKCNNSLNIIKNKAPLIVLLDQLQDPGNIGTIIRSSYGFGCDAIILMDGSCDIWSPKCIRSSMGLCLSIPIIELKWSNIVNDFGQLNEEFKKFQIIIADTNENNVVYNEIDLTKPTIIIIGSESNGISNNALNIRDNVKVQIPMIRKLESLNAAIAGSIIISEATRQRRENNMIK